MYCWKKATEQTGLACRNPPRIIEVSDFAKLVSESNRAEMARFLRRLRNCEICMNRLADLLVVILDHSMEHTKPLQRSGVQSQLFTTETASDAEVLDLY